MKKTEIPATGDDSRTRQELLDEVRILRAKLAESEADLQATNERHQTLSRAINIGYWEWDETVKRAAHFSREMADILGMSLESLYEMYQDEEDFYHCIHPEDLPHYIANLSAVLDPDHPRGLAHIFDYRIVRPNGEVRYVRELEYGTREEDGEVIRSYGAIQDITDLHESTRARVESEQRYSSLFSKLPLGAQEQDWSAIKQAVDQLQSEGVGDLKAYFLDNPSLLKELVASIRITSANDALLKIYGASSVEDYIEDEENSKEWLDEEWSELYASEIATLAGPVKIHYAELAEQRWDGSSFQTRLITSVVEGD